MATEAAVMVYCLLHTINKSCAVLPRKQKQKSLLGATDFILFLFNLWRLCVVLVQTGAPLLLKKLLVSENLLLLTDMPLRERWKEKEQTEKKKGHCDLKAQEFTTVGIIETRLCEDTSAREIIQVQGVFNGGKNSSKAKLQYPSFCSFYFCIARTWGFLSAHLQPCSHGEGVT